MTLPDLVQTALLGTERQSLPTVADVSPVGAVLGRIPNGDRVRALMSAAAVLAGHERVGRGPGRWTGPVTLACPEETRTRADDRAAELLRRILDGEHPVLRDEWLALATAGECLAPPVLLPGLLDCGVRDRDVREALLPVLGERGRWLSGMRMEWNWVAGERWDEAQWQTGDVESRVLFLRQCRRSDPARALALLGESWKQESPEDRVRLLGALEVGLNPSDEPFLEPLLRDKRKEVRRLAADFLLRLPQSTLVQRYRDRALPLLRFVPATDGNWIKLQKEKPACVEVTLPEACPADWQRDGIESRALPGFGEKAGWLIQLLEGVPLSTWTDAWGVEPAALFEASLAGEWSKELAAAWIRAAIRQRNPVWAGVCLEWILTTDRQESWAPLLRVLPDGEREKALGRILAGSGSKARDRIGETLLSGNAMWSVAFSHAVLDWLRALTRQPGSDWMLRGQLKLLAARLHPSLLAQASRGWETGTASPSWEFWSKGMDEFLAVIQFRQELHSAFGGSGTGPADTTRIPT